MSEYHEPEDYVINREVANTPEYLRRYFEKKGYDKTVSILNDKIRKVLEQQVRPDIWTRNIIIAKILKSLEDE